MKIHILNILTLLALAGCNSNTLENYVIEGQLQGIDTGMIKLISYNEEDRSSEAVDSAEIVKGRFKLTGKVKVPEMMGIQIEPGNWNFRIFVENRHLKINADTADATHFDYTAYGRGKHAQIKNYTESGSPNFDAWSAFQDHPGQQQFELALKQLNEKIKAVGDDVDAQYAIRAEMDSVRSRQQAWQKKQLDAYIAAHPDAVAGVFIFNELFRFSHDMPYNVLDSTLNMFSGEAKASKYYQRLDKSRAKLKAVQPGETAPDFTLLQPDSTKLKLSSTRGNYVMLDFWASWCHPCRQAIPHWKSIYQKYHDRGFDILSVSNDNNWENWIKAMDIEKMPWKQVIDEFPKKGMPARVISDYMINTIPHYVLLDKEGKILASTADEEVIVHKLAELFGN